MFKRTLAATIVAALLVVAHPSAAQENETMVGSFALVDMNGAEVTEASYPGKFLIVFFGYTHCPAVCPTSLLVIGQTLDLLGDDADKLQALFITVDPDRDTPEVLADYVTKFHPRLVGLTGSKAQVAGAARAYRVYFARFDAPESDAGYLMDHTASVYMLDPDGRFIGKFAHGTDPEEMARGIRRLL